MLTEKDHWNQRKFTVSKIKVEKEAKNISRSPVERTANPDTDKCSLQFKPTDIPVIIIIIIKPNRAPRFIFLMNFCFQFKSISKVDGTWKERSDHLAMAKSSKTYVFTYTTKRESNRVEKIPFICKVISGIEVRAEQSPTHIIKVISW